MEENMLDGFEDDNDAEEIFFLIEGLDVVDNEGED